MDLLSRRIKLIYKVFFLILYLSFFRYLPASSTPFVGFFFRRLRYLCCKLIFKSCGSNVNIERMAFFGSGFDLEIGDNSGIGINAVIPGNSIIGKNVMMGPNVYILSSNHGFQSVTIPMIEQGHSIKMQTIIEDDVWIGRQVIFTPGREVKQGSIIAAGTVLSKNFPAYSIVGGNPSRLIRPRI